MKVLDLFCGLGGWSDGFASEGFEVLGVEIEKKIARLYKHNVIVADVRTLNGENFKGFDVIVGSPPCRDFSITTFFGKKRWKVKPDPEKALLNVESFLRIVKEANPKFWVLENVPRLQKYLTRKPKATVLMATPKMKRGLWGDFPSFLVPYERGIPKDRVKGQNRKWERARIPFPVASALARACKQSLEKQKC